MASRIAPSRTLASNLGGMRTRAAITGATMWVTKVLNAFSPDDSDEELKVRDRRALMFLRGRRKMGHCPPSYRSSGSLRPTDVSAQRCNGRAKVISLLV